MAPILMDPKIMDPLDHDIVLRTNSVKKRGAPKGSDDEGPDYIPKQ
jgi:hypothetical protein